MKKCTQCGQTFSDDAAFCGNCGGTNFEPIADTGASQPPSPPQQTYYQQPQQQPVYQQPVYPQANQQQYYQQANQQPYYQQASIPGRGKAVASLVLGIIALAFCWWGAVGIIGVTCGIIGTILGISARKELAPEQGRGMATAGMVCSIIALAVGLIAFILAIVACAAVGSILGGLGTLR